MADVIVTDHDPQEEDNKIKLFHRMTASLSELVEAVGLGSIAPFSHDERVTAYRTEAPGLGQVGTITYKKNDVVVATRTFTYDGSDRLINDKTTTP